MQVIDQIWNSLNFSRANSAWLTFVLLSKPHVAVHRLPAWRLCPAPDCLVLFGASQEQVGQHFQPLCCPERAVGPGSLEQGVSSLCSLTNERTEPGKNTTLT